MPKAYYNERDPYAAAWLENLIAAGEIAPGDVDTRDILDVMPADLDGYTQCHFFAGIGIWSRALRKAGWSDDRPVWTGSCPCQPFSAAGAGAAFHDERHLFPGWQWLIEQHRPETVFGEQVASADGLVWADLVQATMEAAGYACGFVDTCAAGFGSFHIRQRLYFAAHDTRSAAGGVGNTGRARSQGRVGKLAGTQGRQGQRRHSGPSGASGGLADAGCISNEPEPKAGTVSGAAGSPEGEAWQRQRRGTGGSAGRATGGMADNDIDGCGSTQAGSLQTGQTQQHQRHRSDIAAHAPDNGWPDADWLFSRDGKWRPVEPGAFPLAHAAPARMGRLRAYGNGLDLEQAAGFIRAYMDRDLGRAGAVAESLFEWSIT